MVAISHEMNALICYAKENGLGLWDINFTNSMDPEDFEDSMWDLEELREAILDIPDGKNAGHVLSLKFSFLEMVSIYDLT